MSRWNVCVCPDFVVTCQAVRVVFFLARFNQLSWTELLKTKIALVSVLKELQLEFCFLNSDKLLYFEVCGHLKLN